jgi:hypothetical protein
VAQEHLEQVVAVHDDVRRSVAGPGRLQVQGGEPPPGQGVHGQQPARPDRRGEHVVEQAVLPQQPGCVGGELQAGAHLGELVGLLEHAHLEAGAAQHQRGGQPADAAADDDRLVGVHDPSSPVTASSGSAPGGKGRRRSPVGAGNGTRRVLLRARSC